MNATKGGPEPLRLKATSRCAFRGFLAFQALPIEQGRQTFTVHLGDLLHLAQQLTALFPLRCAVACRHQFHILASLIDRHLVLHWLHFPPSVTFSFDGSVAASVTFYLTEYGTCTIPFFYGIHIYGTITQCSESTSREACNALYPYKRLDHLLHVALSRSASSLNVLPSL
jgi:hypothetical protein